LYEHAVYDECFGKLEQSRGKRCVPVVYPCE
jgi:hypothetical protein